MDNKYSDVLFLRPPVVESDPRFECDLESLGIEYIVSSCRARGVFCTYIDANLQNLSVDEICRISKDLAPKFVGITITTEQIRPDVIQIIKFINTIKPTPFICVGGHFVSYAFEEVLSEFPEIDAVNIGEGENVIVQLVKAILDKKDYRKIDSIAYVQDETIHYNPLLSESALTNLDAVPWPARDYSKIAVDHSKMFCLVSSRGCYGNCKFCAINSFTKKFVHKKWRGRDINDVVHELKYGIEEFGAKRVLFCDDNFIAPGIEGKERLLKFITVMKEEKICCEFAFFCRVNDIIFNKELIPELRNIGLRHLFIGVESSSQRALKYYNKGITSEMSEIAIEICNENDIFIEVGFIMFEPFVTLYEVIENLKFLKRLRLNSIVRFNTKLSIYYGSEFIPELEAQHLIIRHGYEIEYRFINYGIGAVEKIFDTVFQYSIPILELFYKMKGCITFSWLEKSAEENSEILLIEQSFNDSLTDYLVDKVTFLIDAIQLNPHYDCNKYVEKCDQEIASLIGEHLLFVRLLASHDEASRGC